MSDLFPVEQMIFDRLQRLADGLYDKRVPDSEWTKAFKGELFALGEDLQFSVWGTGGNSEWLWDLCWVMLPEKDAWKKMRGVKLACEIEWKADSGHLLEDFLKLTVAVAEYRLFVFALSKKDEERPERVFDELAAACPGSGGFRYMVIGVPDNQPKALPHRAWTI